MKHFALIGYPLGHSLSAKYFAEKFSAEGIDAEYTLLPIESAEEVLPHCEMLSGFNVTIPHKIDVIQYLDEIDDVACLIGAVNTIDFKEMKGYNTDGIGAIRAIEEVTSIKNKNVVVAGAGGASRAISFYIAKYGADSLTILNRNAEKARNLANDVLNSNLIDNVKSDSISEIGKYLTDGDILIDTTPIGMHPNVNDSPIVKSGDMHEDLVVFDAVYNPNETVLLKEAIKADAKPVYGIKMLLYQGAESFKIWTGRNAPVDVMEDALRKTIDIK